VQKIIASILLFAFVSQTFNQGWYYVDYLIQKKEYMARCVNKARPQMHCDGTCLLMKKIKAQEKKEQEQAPEMKLAAKFEVLPTKPSFTLSADVLLTPTDQYFSILNSGAPIDQPSSIFHPPPVMC
jgi:hypothetical protein